MIYVELFLLIVFLAGPTNILRSVTDCPVGLGKTGSNGR